MDLLSVKLSNKISFFRHKKNINVKKTSNQHAGFCAELYEWWDTISWKHQDGMDEIFV